MNPDINFDEIEQISSEYNGVVEFEKLFAMDQK